MIRPRRLSGCFAFALPSNISKGYPDSNWDFLISVYSFRAFTRFSLRMFGLSSNSRYIRLMSISDIRFPYSRRMSYGLNSAISSSRFISSKKMSGTMTPVDSVARRIFSSAFGFFAEMRLSMSAWKMFSQTTPDPFRWPSWFEYEKAFSSSFATGMTPLARFSMPLIGSPSGRMSVRLTPTPPPRRESSRQ